MKVPARSKKFIRNYTDEIRKILNFSIDEKLDVIKILELVIIPCFNLNLEIVEKSEMPDKYAEYEPLNKIIRIREDTYENALKGKGRDRFTIVHEIGHIFLHSNKVSMARSSDSIPIYCDPEWQANTFAREFLCPLKGVSDNDGVELLAEKYGISKEVAKIQLSQKNKTTCQ